MKQSAPLFLLTILLVAASCGTTAQYSSQQFPDGIYFRHANTSSVVLLTSEEIEAMAAQRLAESKNLDRLDSLLRNYNGTINVYMGMTPYVFGSYYDPWYRGWMWDWDYYGPWTYRYWGASWYRP